MERLTRLVWPEIRRPLRSVFQVGSLVVLTTLAREAAAQSWKPEPEKNRSPSPAQLAEAKQRYEKGVKLYEDEGSVQAALVEFERAYDLAPNYKVLYNIGQAARTVRDFASALRAFEAYLEGGQGKIPKARAAEVERDISQLRTYVATLTVQVDTDGAAIAIDNVAFGTSPLAKPVLVNAGRTTVTASKGGRTATATVTLAGGDVQQVRIEIPAATPDPSVGDRVVLPPAASTAPPAAPPPARAADRTGPYLAFGLGSAFAATAGITGYAALRTSKNLEKDRFAGPKPSTDTESLQTRTRRLSLASDVLAGAAVVSVAVGVVLLVLEPRSARSAESGLAHAREPLRPTLRPFVSPSSAGLEGVF